MRTVLLLLLCALTVAADASPAMAASKRCGLTQAKAYGKTYRVGVYIDRGHVRCSTAKRITRAASSGGNQHGWDCSGAMGTISCSKSGGAKAFHARDCTSIGCPKKE